MRAPIAPLLLALLALAIAGTALGVSITAYVRANVVNGGRYLVSTADGRFKELDMVPLSPTAFEARRSIRIDTHNATATGRSDINMTVSLIRSGPFRMLFLSQTSDGAPSDSPGPTLELNLTDVGAILPGDIPVGDDRLLAHTGVAWGTSTQRDIVSRFNLGTGGVTITAPGPATAEGFFPTVGVFKYGQLTSILRTEGTVWAWHVDTT